MSAGLDDEVYLKSRVFFAVVSDNGVGRAYKLCEDIVFSESPLVFAEYVVTNKYKSRRYIGHGSEQAHIEQVELERVWVDVKFQREGSFGEAGNFIYESGVDEPLQRILIFCSTRSFF